MLLSISRAVRSNTRGWVVSDEGHRWSVKLDVRDLGGHLDTTFHGWSSTLASRVRLVISRLVLVSALPLDFHGRLRVLRSMFIPGALHGIEASFRAGTSLRKLRAALFGGLRGLVGSLLPVLVQVVILPFVLFGFVFC